jgi:hypothetical protein
VYERVRQEIELVRERWTQVECGEAGAWMHLPGHPLPPGRFNKAISSVVVLIPPGYPNTGPDNFFVDGSLRLADGSVPAGFNAGASSGSGACPLPGNWGWFSWHPQRWTPHPDPGRGDNLLGVIRAINACLRGEEAT